MLVCVGTYLPGRDGWLLGPVAFLLTTTGIAAMLLRRQFGPATAIAIDSRDAALVRPRVTASSQRHPASPRALPVDVARYRKSRRPIAPGGEYYRPGPFSTASGSCG